MIDVLIEDYHNDTSRVSKSGLDLINRSPAHYYAQYLDPKRNQREITKSYLVGGAIHVAALEPEDFSSRYVMHPAIKRNSNAGKEAWEEFVDLHSGKTILSPQDYDTAMYARKAIQSHPTASKLIGEGEAEKTFYWNDPETGAPCKCRPDFLNSDGFVIDIKSTEDARPKPFGRSCHKYRYDVAGSLYTDGIFYAANWRPKAFIFIAVEKKPPYNVAVYYLMSDHLEQGREKYLYDLGVYVDCRKSNKWHGYNQEIQPVSLPNWTD